MIRSPLSDELARLAAWRDDLATNLVSLMRWHTDAKLQAPDLDLSLADAQQRLRRDRLRIALVGEPGRGKATLLRALFYAEAGFDFGIVLERLKECPVAIRCEAATPRLRLLPYSVGNGGSSANPLELDDAAWTTIPLDATAPASLATALDKLPAQSWRLVQLDAPHPLLKQGLEVWVVPSIETLGVEPALSRVLNEADALVFVLGADTPISRREFSFWKARLAQTRDTATCALTVLNKIDWLRDGVRGESQVLAEVDRAHKAAAGLFGIDPIGIYAVSALDGLAGKSSDNRDRLAKSRLYILEQALARDVVARHHARLVAREQRALAELLEGSGTRIEGRKEERVAQIEELTELHGKNARLVDSLVQRTERDKLHLEKAATDLKALRKLETRQSEFVLKALDPHPAQRAAENCRAAILKSQFSASIKGALEGYFGTVEKQLEQAAGHMVELQKMFAAVYDRFRDEYRFKLKEVHPFPTQRFNVEVDSLRQSAFAELVSPSNLLTRDTATMATLFFNSVAARVEKVFSIAQREFRAWLRGAITPLEEGVSRAQAALGDKYSRLVRVRDAEADLRETMDALTAGIDELTRRRADLSNIELGIKRVLES